MKTSSGHILFLLIAAAATTISCAGTEQGRRLPHVLVLMADDFGIGDLGCYGNKTVPTPNLDRLCEEGAKFTHLVATAPMCTPSRASFLTGKYPGRVGLTEGPNTLPVIGHIASPIGLAETETTWADYLATAGYRTAAFGKWHLGWDKDWLGDQKFGPLGHGFEYFFGLPNTLFYGVDADHPFFTLSEYTKRVLWGNFVTLAVGMSLLVYVFHRRHFLLVFIVAFCLFATWFLIEHYPTPFPGYRISEYFFRKFNSVLMENRDIIQQPLVVDRLTDALTRRSIDFMRQSLQEHPDQPMAIFFSFPNVHTPLLPAERFVGRSAEHGPYGDSIIEMDSAVGELLDFFDSSGIASDTLVFFASDHGCHVDIGRLGGSNAPFRGGKAMGALEGAIRVPGMVRWPGVVRPGSVVETPVSLADWMPTVAHLVQKEAKDVDGVSFLDLLTKGDPSPRVERVMRHYCGTSLHALRLTTQDGPVYKAYFRNIRLNEKGLPLEPMGSPCFGDKYIVESIERPVIYNVDTDPAEERPISEDGQAYKSLLPTFQKAFEAAERDRFPPSQFSSVLNSWPRPWLQPCARFPTYPFCTTA